MTGIGFSTKAIGAIANGDFINPVLGTSAWSNSIIYYSFPTSNLEYLAPYSSFNEYAFGFNALNSAQQTAARWALSTVSPGAAQDGFSVEGFTNLDIRETTLTGATIRLADSTQPATAVGYFPAVTNSGGDIWFRNGVFEAPEMGTYQWLTVMHEIGHALGLQHAHETGTGHGTMPTKWDTMEFTIMTYRSFVGHDFNSTGGYTNATFDYAQSYMMADIYALQVMYGADYTTNAGKTTYKWKPGSGETMVNGQVAIEPKSNVIFATIWDGGGKDTYDLSAYKSGVNVDLRPGSHSVFESGQLASLGSSQTARGSIFNALLFEGDMRSIIENAKGGKGNDTIKGNTANNKLQGNGGNDKISGGDGNDNLLGGSGADKLFGQGDNDKLTGGKGKDVIKGQGGKDTLTGNAGNDKLTGGGKADKFVYKKGFDEDIITDMKNNQDVIKLDDNLWSGKKSVSKVLTQFGQADGKDYVLDFGGGDTLTIKKMSKADLVNDIDIV